MSDHFATPQDIKDRYPGHFDPCPLKHDLRKWDGLKIGWTLLSSSRFVFVNPPYSDIRSWLIKAREELNKGHIRQIVFLLPVWTDRAWFHDLVLPFDHKIEFIRGRVKFLGGEHTPTFPSMLITFNGVQK